MLNRISSSFNRLSNLSSLQLFQLIRYGTFVFIGICFAKLNVSLSQIGSFETFILLNGLVSFFWVSGFINTLLAVYPKKNETEKRVLLFNTFLSLIFFSVLSALFLFLFSNNLLSFLHKQNTDNLILPVVVYLLLNTPCFITEYILYLNEKKNALVIYAIITSLLTISAAVIPALLGYQIQHSIYALIIVSTAKLFFTVLVLQQNALFVFDWKLQLTNFKLALPLILTYIVSGSAEYIDGIIVKWKFDDVFFAVFRYGAKELPVLLIISNTLSVAMLPSIAADLTKGLEELKQKSAKLMHLFFPLTIVLLLTSSWLYKIVFNESFAYSALIFNFYLLLVIPRVVFPQTILTGTGQTKFLLISSLIEIVINVSLSIYLAGKIGLPGIALGTFIAYCFDKIFLVTVNYFQNGIAPSAYIRLAPFVFYSLATLVAFAVGFQFLHA